MSNWTTKDATASVNANAARSAPRGAARGAAISAVAHVSLRSAKKIKEGIHEAAMKTGDAIENLGNKLKPTVGEQIKYVTGETLRDAGKKIKGEELE